MSFRDEPGPSMEMEPWRRAMNGRRIHTPGEPRYPHGQCHTKRARLMREKGIIARAEWPLWRTP